MKNSIVFGAKWLRFRWRGIFVFLARANIILYIPTDKVDTDGREDKKTMHGRRNCCEEFFQHRRTANAHKVSDIL